MEIVKKLGIGTLAGIEVNLDENMVVNGKKPLKDRFYYGSRIERGVKCIDENGLYQNVELFQPVIYDMEQQAPKFDPRWMQYDSDSSKTRKIVNILFPSPYKAWWYEQRKRCIEGYTVGGVHLTGVYYFFLNFWRIRSKEKGVGWIAPRFIDLQKEVADGIAIAQESDKNFLWLKRRQIGASEFLAAYAGHEYTFYPLSRGLIVGGEDKYALNTIDKVSSGLDGFLPNGANAGREFFKRRKSGLDKREIFECGFLDNTGAKLGYQAQVEAITTADNIQSANGKSPTYCLLEEAGINRHLEVVYEMILPAMQERGKQNGRIVVIVGTGGDMSRGATQLMDMFYNPNNYNILSTNEVYEDGIVGTAMFSPAWKFYVMDEDGNSYKDASIELIEKNRKLKPKGGLITYKTQMPLTPSEAFILGGKCPFNAEKLEAQARVLRQNNAKELMQWGRIDWVFEGTEEDVDLSKIQKKRKPIGVEWIACPEGMRGELDKDGDMMYPICITEHPERKEKDAKSFKILFSEQYYEGLYAAGMDPYNKDEAGDSAYSKGSTSIVKGFLNVHSTSHCFPARLSYRPHKKDKFYEMSVRLQMYYGKCKVLIEWSNDAPLDWYRQNGWEFLLKERPMFTYADVANSQVINKYGVDPSTKHVWEEHYAEYIEDYVQNIIDPEQIGRSLAYRKKKGYNCDDTISTMLAWEHIKDDIHMGVVARDSKKEVNGMPLSGMYTVRTRSGFQNG